MKNLIVLFLFYIQSSAVAQPQVDFEFEQKNYHYENDVLWVTDDNSNQAFEVNRGVITVKFIENHNASEMSDFFQRNNFSVIRRAATGYSDIKVNPQAEHRTLLLTLKNSGLFSVIESNTIGKYLLIPNDSQYPTQWHLPKVNAEAAWDITTGDASIIVAVLDSGTEFNHSDLGSGTDSYNNIWINPGEDRWADPEDPSSGNGIDDDDNGFIDDWKGWDFDNDDNDGSGSFFHGTAVAGVTAAKTNNNNGVAGMAGGNSSKGTSIMIGNVGNTAPNGAVLDDAILYATKHGAHIVQLSLRVANSQALDAAIDMAYNQGVLIINAAGNAGNSVVAYPASHPNVMAVGASNMIDLKAQFSQYGDDLEVSAPGENIVTTNPNNSYTVTSGTSFAAPLTSGIAALVMSQYPSLTNDEVRQILKSSADKVGGYNYNHDPSKPGHSLEMGYGRVNALNALNLARSLVTPFIFTDGFEGLPDVIFSNGFESITE